MLAIPCLLYWSYCLLFALSLWLGLVHWFCYTGFGGVFVVCFRPGVAIIVICLIVLGVVCYGDVFLVVVYVLFDL